MAVILLKDSEKTAVEVKQSVYFNDNSSPLKNLTNPIHLEFHAQNPNIMANSIAEYNIEQEKIKVEEEKAKKEIELKEQKSYEEEQEREQRIVSRGGYSKSKKIKIYITYYTNANTKLEGGQLDKKGKKLTSHNEFICAMPKDIPYGSFLILDDAVPVISNGKREQSNQFKIVDSGGAIRWRNSDKTECYVDIFVPNVSSNWLSNNMGKQTRTATLYYR